MAGRGFLTTICLKFAVTLVHFVSAISGQLGEGAGGGAGRFNDQSLRTSSPTIGSEIEDPPSSDFGAASEDEDDFRRMGKLLAPGLRWPLR